MARYFFTPERLIKNLTSVPVTSYDYSGGFTTFPPVQFENTPDVVYIVDEEQYKELIELGIDKERLFLPMNKGIGRSGKEVCYLLTEDYKIRLMARGE